MFLKFKHVILPFQDPFGDTIVSMSFHAIIYQVVPSLEFMFIEHSELTRNNKWQAHIFNFSILEWISLLRCSTCVAKNVIVDMKQRRVH